MAAEDTETLDMETRAATVGQLTPETTDRMAAHDKEALTAARSKANVAAHLATLIAIRSSANSGYGRNGGYGASANRGNSGVTASRGSNAGNYGAGGELGARAAGYSRSGTNGSYDSNRPPGAQQRGFDGRTTAGNFGANRPTSSGANLGRVASSGANRPDGGRTMTASYASATRGGSSVGRGGIDQRAGSNGFQSDRPPSARSMPERSSVQQPGAGNRGTSNMNLAGGNRSGMNFGASHFGNAGPSSRTSAGGSRWNSSNGFGHSNSFAGSRFGSSGRLFGRSGFQNAGYGARLERGGVGITAMVVATVMGHGWGYGRGWGYGHGWGYGWGPGWGWGWGGGWGFLDDLFGLALNATTYALNPWSPFATLGADLIGDGVQALGNLDNNNKTPITPATPGFFMGCILMIPATTTTATVCQARPASFGQPFVANRGFGGASGLRNAITGVFF